jgi:hypothetical protein
MKTTNPEIRVNECDIHTSTRILLQISRALGGLDGELDTTHVKFKVCGSAFGQDISTTSLRGLITSV